MTLWRHWMVGQLDASIVAAMLLAIAVLLRHRLQPGVRSAILLIALVRLVLPPWLRSPWSEALVDLPPLDDGRMLITMGLYSDLAMYAAAAASLVTLFLLARIAWTLVTAERRWIARTAATSIAPKADTTRIEIRVSRDGEGPLAVGLRRKLIILPESALQLNRDALDAVLAHEIAHHERRDLWWLAAAEVLKAIAWFNPLAHLIARALVASREDGSDDWAVRRTSNDPFTYAQALLQSARMVAMPQAFHPATQTPRRGGPALGVAGAHPMGRRLQRLLDGRTTRAGRLGLPGVAVVLVAATVALPGAHLPRLADSEQDQRIVIVIRR